MTLQQMSGLYSTLNKPYIYCVLTVMLTQDNISSVGISNKTLCYPILYELGECLLIFSLHNNNKIAQSINIPT